MNIELYLLSTYNLLLYLAGANFVFMQHLMLNAFYDSINYTIGPIMIWVFTLLMLIELIYVMFKYLGGSPDGKNEK